ncbi:MAG: HAD family phosphatase [Acidobacteriota bacterium]|nr:HAD family phosphatase [Acidobacteriota bacterium]
MDATSPAPLAFYDFDGTLVSGNIVSRYAFLVRRLPGRIRSNWKFFRLLTGVPGYLMLDYVSRRRFNVAFFKEYRGMRLDWLASQAQALFDELIRPSIYAGAKHMVEADRVAGFRTFLVSGELDFILKPVIGYFGFDGCISNSLVFERGVATGEVTPPLIAESAKVEAMKAVCSQQQGSLRRAKGYSDSFSDLPMLEAVGLPCAVNPDKRLRAAAEERSWPVRNLRKGEESSGFTGRNYGDIS